MADCGFNCMKYLLFIFNILAWVMGGAVLGFAIWLRVDGNSLGILVDESWFTASYILMAVGGLIFIIAFCGCFGAMRESACLLSIYFAIMLAIFITEVAGSIYAAVNRQMLENEVKTKLTDDVQDKYNQPGSNIITTAIDNLQANLKCCGVTAPENWSNSTWSKAIPSAVNTVYGPPVPDSCCRTRTHDCGIAVRPSQEAYNNTIYQTGCYYRMDQIVNQNLTAVIAILATFAAIQVLGMCLSMGLIIMIRRDKVV